MSRDGDPTFSDALGEWEAASSRTLLLSDSGLAQLFLINSPDTLYLGVTYEHGNNGDGCGVVIYFDEGSSSPPADLDGGTDFTLYSANDLCNEQAGSVLKFGGSNLNSDKCWNGSTWADDGDGEIDFRAARHFFNSDNKVHHYEFAIPLNNSKTDDSLNSDLDVLDTAAVGFYLEVIKTGTGAGTFHWIETNGDNAHPYTFPHWGKIQLSVKRSFFTFYTGRSTGPLPTIDGIIQEPVWNGAYQRNLVLSNYHYGTFDATVWGLEDPAGDQIYVGVRVFDPTFDSSDYCQIYLEEAGENTTDSIRDYDLDDNAENSLRITGDGQFSDYFWDINAGQWVPDTEEPDLQTAAAQAGSGYTDFEFMFLRSGGSQDIDIPERGLLGFLIQYHDNDRTGEHADFYWEYTTNNNAQLLSQHRHPFYYLSTGWNNLQLSGPYIEIVTPAANDTLMNSVDIEILVGNDSQWTVEYFPASDPSNKTSLTDMGGGVWTATLDLTNYPLGNETLVIRVISPDGSIYERLVNVTIADSSLGLPPFSSSGPKQLSIAGMRPGASLVIGLEKISDVTLQLRNLSGQTLWSRRFEQLIPGYHHIAWPPLRLQNGVYFLSLTRGQHQIVRRFAIVR
jgi:hypothetical protein